MRKTKSVNKTLGKTRKALNKMKYEIASELINESKTTKKRKAVSKRTSKKK